MRSTAQINNMCRRLRRAVKEILSAEKGSVTAEFAMVLPAVLLVVAVILAALSLSAKQVNFTAVAAEIARLEARGDVLAAGSLQPPNTQISREHIAGLLCVTVTGSGQGLGRALTVAGRSCAALVSDSAD